jgi:hypothetical protein
VPRHELQLGAGPVAVLGHGRKLGGPVAEARQEVTALGGPAGEVGAEGVELLRAAPAFGGDQPRDDEGAEQQRERGRPNRGDDDRRDGDEDELECQRGPDGPEAGRGRHAPSFGRRRPGT